MNKTFAATMFSLGMAGMGFILYKSFQNKKVKPDPFVKPPPGVRLPDDMIGSPGGVSPGLPQRETHSQSIDGERSAYVPPPGKTRIGQVASNVSRIRAEGWAHGAQVNALKKAADALPVHRKPDGSGLRTAGPMQCAELVAAGKFNEAKANGCTTSLCSKYVEDIENFASKVALLRKEIDTRRRGHDNAPLAKWQLESRTAKLHTTHKAYRNAQRRFKTECNS